MNNSHKLRGFIRMVVIALIGVHVVSSHAPAQDKNTEKEKTKSSQSGAKTDVEKSGKAKLMFNGKDLTGWKKIDDTYFKKSGEVKVIDGEILIGKGSPGSGIIVDGKNRKDLLLVDYIIELEAKRTDGGDFFCGMTFPIKDKYLSMIIGGWGGKVTGLSNLNNLSAIENETTGVHEFENDKWYKIKLKVTADKIEAWLDGENIISVDISDKELTIWWEQEPVRPLGISTWYTEARVRNIKVTDISKSGTKGSNESDSDQKTERNSDETNDGVKRADEKRDKN